MRVRDEAQLQGIFSEFLRGPAAGAFMRSLARAWCACSQGVDHTFTAPGISDVDASASASAAAFELKVAHVWKKGVAGMRFAQVEPHQELALARACGRSDDARLLVHKISDFSPERKPFDCFVLARAMAYVVIGYIHGPHGTPWTAYALPWPAYSAHKAAAGGRGSVSEEDAARLGVLVPIG